MSSINNKDVTWNLFTAIWRPHQPDAEVKVLFLSYYCRLLQQDFDQGNVQAILDDLSYFYDFVKQALLLAG